MPFAIIKLDCWLLTPTENLQKPIIGQKTKIFRWVFLITQMKCQNTLLQRKKPKLFAMYHCWKNQEIPPKMGIFGNGYFWCFFVIFSATVQRKELRVFLRWNLCIPVLHLGYQTFPYNGFHFLAYIVFFFFNFSDTL